MSIMTSLNISASGMTAQRTRMDIIAQNVANVNTTRDKNGDPYRRQTVVFEERAAYNRNFESYLTAQKTGLSYNPQVGSGVKISAIVYSFPPAFLSKRFPALPIPSGLPVYTFRSGFLATIR